MNNHPDFLRSPESVLLPDPRNAYKAVLNDAGFEPLSLADHHARVAELVLHEGVPEKIRIQFETSKNIYLYAWFVYRFYPVVYGHVFACLELALRGLFRKQLFEKHEVERRAKHETKSKTYPGKYGDFQPGVEEDYRPGLKRLLQCAMESGLLKNESFTVWQIKRRLRAKTRQLERDIQFMKDNGIDTMPSSDPDTTITDEDRADDFLSRLSEGIPEARNEFAHGSTALDDRSFAALRTVSEILNQVFPKPK